MPTRGCPGDAGLDLYAALDGELVIAPGAFARIPTDVAMAIPMGYEGQIRPRSSATGRVLIIPTGTVDSGYRGGMQIQVVNLSSVDQVVEPGERIAQIVIAPVASPRLVRVSELGASERGSAGFGSSGR